jgi:hypothetical protein
MMNELDDENTNPIGGEELKRAAEEPEGTDLCKTKSFP